MRLLKSHLDNLGRSNLLPWAYSTTGSLPQEVSRVECYHLPAMNSLKGIRCDSQRADMALEHCLFEPKHAVQVVQLDKTSNISVCFYTFGYPSLSVVASLRCQSFIQSMLAKKKDFKGDRQVCAQVGTSAWRYW